MNKILFLANIQYGDAPTGGGVQTRNQFMLDWLIRKYDVRFFDTWKKPAIVSIITSLCLSIINSNRLIVISYGGRGALLLIKILSFFHCKREVIFFVPGGDFIDVVKSQDLKYWTYFYEIFVQSKNLLNKLNKLGLSNISYCPNFKSINYRPVHKLYKRENPLRFVYVGRLIEEKGIQIMIDACKNIEEDFVLTIYGKETINYNKSFFDLLEDKRIVFKGYLNLNTNEGYDELASYDVLLFPTFFGGEGFSGTLIDAFICGLPIIATDFNVNSEIIKDGVSGILIPPRNVEALSYAMKRMIHGEVDINKMSKSSYESANNYNLDIVMGNIFNKLQ